MAEARASSTSGSSESGWAAPASSLAILHASVPDLGGGDPAQLPSGAPAATLPPKAGDGAATAGMPPLISRPADHRGSILEILACPRAGFFWRLAATILDLLAVWAVTHFLTRNDRYNPLASGRGFLTVWLAYHVGMWLWKGTTLGGSVFGLRCVRTNGAPLDWRVAFMRAFASCVSFLALGLGFFWVAWDPEKQSWHDKIADTMIVKMPRAIALV